MPIRGLRAADAVRCDEIVAALPYFFGVEACARTVRTQRGWAAEVGGVVVGFLTVEEQPDNYAGTRRFYRSAGFQPVRELELAGWGQPALLMSRQLAETSRAARR